MLYLLPGEQRQQRLERHRLAYRMNAEGIAMEERDVVTYFDVTTHRNADCYELLRADAIG